MPSESRKCPNCDVPLGVVSAGRVCDSVHCRIAYRRHLESGGRTCLVCGTPLTGASVLGEATCGKPQCQIQYLRQKDLPDDRRCRVCRVPLMPHRIQASICDDRECGTIDAGTRLGERNQQEKDRIGRVRTAGKERRLIDAAKQGIDDPDSWAVAVVPNLSDPLAPSDSERVGQMRVRLESIVAWAFSHETGPEELHQRPGWSSAADSEPSVYQPDDIAEEASDIESPIFSTGCRLCRGFCCKTGGVHAYLNIGLIRKFISENPGLTRQQVIDAYLNRVPELSVENSCVFHGKFGCSLPREMRSDMCNRWLCPGLTKIRHELNNGVLPKYYIVSADEEKSSEKIMAAGFAGISESANQGDGS